MDQPRVDSRVAYVGVVRAWRGGRIDYAEATRGQRNRGARPGSLATSQYDSHSADWTALHDCCRFVAAVRNNSATDFLAFAIGCAAIHLG